jgi:isoprenylcysteine carboxyl methyltransferase (ICMT) family protein YpbQ
MKEEKILKRDDRLIKNEKSWRRARIGAIFLAIIHILILVFVIKEPSILQGEKEGLISLIVWVVFWLLVIDWLNLRLGHIDSIKLYRNKIKQ